MALDANGDVKLDELNGYEEMVSYLTMLRLERNLSEHTLRNYEIDITDYLLWADRSGLDPFSLKHRQLRAYLADLDKAKYAKATINRHLSSIKGFYTWLDATGIKKGNPASALTGPKLDAKLPKAMKEADVALLLDVYSKKLDENGVDQRTADQIRDKAVLELLYACGVRVSEASTLSCENVDFNNKLIKVFGKGSKERIVPIHDEALRCMKEYLEFARPKLLKGKRCDSFFVSNRGNEYSDQAIRRMFKCALKLAGLDESFSPHAMRHTFATDILNGGADLRSVQEMLGHSSLSTTQIYTHMSPERLLEVHKQAHPRG